MMTRYTYEYPEEVKAPSTGISRPAQAISSGAEYIKDAVPSALEWGGRQLARTGARIAESALGAPADILSGALGLGGVLEQATQGEPQILSQAHELARNYLPTSENIRKYGTEKVAEQIAPEGYLDPQDEWEKQADNWVDLFAGIASPLTGAGRFTVKGLSAAAKEGAKLATAGSVGKWAAESLGAGEGWQQAASTGAMLLTSLAGAPKMKEYASGLYEKAKRAVSKNTPEEVEMILKDLGPNAPFNVSKVSRKGIKDFSARRLGAGMEKSRELIREGLSNDGKKIAQENLAEIAGKISKGKIPLSEVAAVKKSINENIYKTSNRDAQRAAEEYLSPVKDALIDTIKESAKGNPEFANNLLEADKIWAAIKNEDIISTVLQKYIKTDINELKNPLFISFLSGIAAVPLSFIHPYLGKAAATAAVGIPAYVTVRAARVFYNSPQARQYYKDFAKSALKNNIPRMLRDIKKLDHAFVAAEREEEKDEGKYTYSYE
jgi:hypothetical protein